MIGGKVFAAKLPERRIEITDINDVSGSVVNFDPIAHPVWPAHNNVNPTDKTGHRSLDGKANDN